MYSWPLDTIRDHADSPPAKAKPEKLREALAEAGYGASLIDLLVPLYEHADGATFFDGAFRVHPFNGLRRQRVPGLIEWNDPGDWKQYAPARATEAFFFMSNAFGDQLGIPIDDHGEVARDTLAILWVEKYKYEEAGAPWQDGLQWILTDEDDTGTYLARLKEYEWAAEELGRPESWQCFSSKLPPLLGGDDTIDNVQIVALPVHVSFTLQVIEEALREEEQEDDG